MCRAGAGTSGLQLLAQFSSNLWQTQQITVTLMKNDSYQSVTTQSGSYPEPIGRHLGGDTFYKHVLIVLLHFRIHSGFLSFKPILFFSRTCVNF